MVYTRVFNNNTLTCKYDYIVIKQKYDNRIAGIDLMICIHCPGVKA